MSKAMSRDRADYEAGELLQSKKFQARALAKKGYSVALISKMLKILYFILI